MSDITEQVKVFVKGIGQLLGVLNQHINTYFWFRLFDLSDKEIWTWKAGAAIYISGITKILLIQISWEHNMCFA